MNIKLILFLIIGAILSFANILILARGLENNYISVFLISTIFFIVGLNIYKKDKWILIISLIAVALSVYDVYVNGVEYATDTWIDSVKVNKNDSLIKYYFSLSGSVVWIAVFTFFKEIKNNRKKSIITNE